MGPPACPVPGTGLASAVAVAVAVGPTASSRCTGGSETEALDDGKAGDGEAEDGKAGGREPEDGAPVPLDVGPEAVPVGTALSSGGGESARPGLRRPSPGRLPARDSSAAGSVRPGLGEVARAYPYAGPAMGDPGAGG
ncbi:hypothetical protein H1V43_06785 [Streptomyces sp. PSKA54]|uniref:Uncharacterized protein n=1 Tax=Streptomyces himalayensis subsp. aureolus TaxID=2758039 RepID=A0A7W2HEP1_9ACTN|nr:hypothetical protein [Streptomyces himalayensis]MBA4861092.1 hypothetical protein [Streptomyces himalayensis subsp. aureolus]